MGECINLNWQNVDNTLSKRMIDDSLIHLLDRVQKKMSKTTIICNRNLKKLHMLKNYEHFVEIKTKIKNKLSNNDEYESSNTEVSSDEENLNDTRDGENDIKKNEESSQYENEHNTLPKDKSNDSVPVNNVVPQSTNDDEKNESETDDNSVGDSINSCNNRSILENHSDMISDDEMNKLVIDDSSTEDLINNHNNDDTIENHSNVISDDEMNKLVIDDSSTEDLINNNDDTMENHSNVISDDEESKLETHDNSTKDSINSPKNESTTENHNNKTPCQRDRPTLKIIMTEIVKPRYTLIQHAQTTLNTTEKLIHNRKSTDELSGDNESIELESSQRNVSSIQESNENDTNNDDSIDSTRNENAIKTKKRGIKNKNKRIKRKDIILNDNQNSQSLNKITEHINGFDTNLETLNSPMIEGVETISDSNVVTDSINLSKKTGKIGTIENRKSQSPLSDERAALAYTLEHIAYLKHRQERLNHESQLLNENIINIENESREDSISEQENDLLQSNVLARRPTTLDEFIQGNDIVPLDDKLSAFTLDDLSEDDDLFLMEMPKSVINQKLLGQKMVVRNFDMTIGSINYQLHRLKNDALTCILKENNERMSFKAVNVKPKGTFVVKRILAPSIEDVYFHQSFDITDSRCPFPNNLKVRNPLENKNKRLKKYKKKIRKDAKKKVKKV